MKELILLVVGGLGGFVLHSIAMKVSFKQRTIDNKIKIFDSLIGTWVQMRNFVYAHHNGMIPAPVPPETARQFDQMYGQSQQLIGEAILVCEDEALTAKINSLNERMYRTEWQRLTLDEANEQIEQFKRDAMLLISRMREDVKGSTRFEWRDFAHIASGFVPSARKAQQGAQPDAQNRRAG